MSQPTDSRYPLQDYFRNGILASEVVKLNTSSCVSNLLLRVSAISLINPDISPAETVFVWAAQNILPIWLGVIVLSGIVAAGLSSYSMSLSLVGFNFFHDLFEISGISILERYETDEKYLQLSRFFMLAFEVVIFVVIYFQPPAVLWIGYFAASIFAAAWGSIAFASVHWSRTSKTGALWRIILGFITIISAKSLAEYGSLSLPTYLTPEVIGFVVSLIAVIAGSYINEPTKTERERRREMINNVGTATPHQIQTTLNYTRIAILSGVLLTGGLLFFYYTSYIE